jgi:hypothetical protein
MERKNIGKQKMMLETDEEENQDSLRRGKFWN